MDEFPDLFLEKLEQAHYYDAGYIVSLCPFHSESRPSFFVYEDTYRCASCNRWGKTSDLLEKLDKTHVYPHQEQSYSHNPFSKWLKGHSLSDIIKVAHANIPIQYLRDRGIDADVQKRLGLGFLDNWITFPIHDAKSFLIGAVARAGENNSSKSKYILPFQQDPNLLYVPSWTRCQDYSDIYLTFGILDAVTLYAAGFASMSTTTGKRITAMAFDTIRKKVIIIPDSGEEKEALKLASKLGWRGRVLQLKYPENCKDINDITWKLKMDLSQLRKMINEQI